MKTWPFFSYFFRYIFFSKTRQRLLFIAVIGLFISSFSLMVVQGIMGGLQNGLIQRSKNINGSYVLQFKEYKPEEMLAIKELLLKEGILFYTELEAEVLLKHKGFVAPAKIHGINIKDEKPVFLSEKDFSGVVIGSDLASKIKLKFMDEFQIIAPGVTDSLLGEVPRFVTETPSDYLYTELPEVDEFELWVRLEVVQNLLREKSINKIRIFGDVSEKVKEKLLEGWGDRVRLLSWEEMNGALVWSLNLETKVMLFLFIGMSLLVAIAITSGLLIFYSKIKRDLMSFWILGMDSVTLFKLCLQFTLTLSGLTVLLGGSFGYGLLGLLERFGHVWIPEIFVERQVPVSLGFEQVVLSLFIPFTISLIFNWFSFKNFRRENSSFVSIVRGIG